MLLWPLLTAASEAASGETASDELRPWRAAAAAACEWGWPAVKAW